MNMYNPEDAHELSKYKAVFNQRYTANGMSVPYFPNFRGNDRMLLND